MDRKTQWMALLAGCFLLLLGVRTLYLDGDWALLIISVLIIAFSVSSMLKSGGKT